MLVQGAGKFKSKKQKFLDFNFFCMSHLITLVEAHKNLSSLQSKIIENLLFLAKKRHFLAIF